MCVNKVHSFSVKWLWLTPIWFGVSTPSRVPYIVLAPDLLTVSDTPILAESRMAFQRFNGSQQMQKMAPIQHSSFIVRLNL